MKKLVVASAIITVFLILPLLAIMWFFGNATWVLARLDHDGEWGYYATRAEMMDNSKIGAAYWFRGWRAVPIDATEIAFVGVTTPEGCGPWETRMTCRTTEAAFRDMARIFEYPLATNSFVNALSERDGGFPNDSPAFVEVLPELFPLTMPKDYLAFACLTTNYTGMVMLLNRQSGKLYARLINKWRFGDNSDWRWLSALPELERRMQKERSGEGERDPLFMSSSSSTGRTWTIRQSSENRP